MGDDSFDVIVIGSGLGGLSAGALLARGGKRVVVLERHDRVGGYAHAFRRGPYLFDSAVHMIGGVEPSPAGGRSLLDRMLRVCGVRDRLAFQRIEPFYKAFSPGHELTVPTGIEAFVEAHCDEFPADADGIRELTRLSQRLAAESFRFPPRRWWQWMLFPFTHRALMRYRNATVGSVVDRFIHGEEARSVYTALWGYLGLPPSRLSFIYWSAMLLSFVEVGAFVVEGSFQRLADALAEAVRRRGGEVRTSTAAAEILVEQGQARGVRTEAGETLRAPVVVSNADATHTFGSLVGHEHLPAPYVEQLSSLETSLSGFVVYGAMDRSPADWGLTHENLYTAELDHDATYRGLQAAEPSGICLHIPSLSDPSRAPEGEYIFSITTLVPHAIDRPWSEAKPALVERSLGHLEALAPGSRDHVVFSEGATPQTMVRYTGNEAGAAYGWALTPQQVGLGRLRPQTPIPNLWLAGHWTQPGGGIVGVIRSGAATAASILGYPFGGDLLDALERDGQ